MQIKNLSQNKIYVYLLQTTEYHYEDTNGSDMPKHNNHKSMRSIWCRTKNGPDHMITKVIYYIYAAKDFFYRNSDMMTSKFTRISGLQSRKHMVSWTMWQLNDPSHPEIDPSCKCPSLNMVL